VSDVLAEWDKHHREIAGIGAEMLGAAGYFERHPEEATDARLADAFRYYAERLRAVRVPA
jgi:hypothetical protein